MNKDYQKPEVELVNLTSMEAITDEIDTPGLPGGEENLESSIF